MTCIASLARRAARQQLLWAVLAFTALAPETSAQEVSLQDLQQGTHVHGLAVSRTDPSQLYVATHHGIYLLRADAKATLISPVQDFMGFAPHPDDPSVFFASGHPSGGGNLGFIMSTDGGASWRQISPGSDGPVDFHQLAVSPVDPKVIFGAYGAIQVSEDGGASWRIAGAAPDGLIALAASTISAKRLYAATKTGLLVSDDLGAAWRSAGVDGRVVSLVAVDSQGNLFAFALGAGLMRAAAENLTQWAALGGDFGDSIPLHLAIDPADSNRLFLATNDNRLLASIDGGLTWRDFGQP